MDRNDKIHIITEIPKVALRKESVDRNKDNADTVKAYAVALRKESVDRNYSNTSQIGDSKQSLSARRAWIEIRGIYHFTNDEICRSPQGERG